MLLKIKFGERTNPTGRGVKPKICVLKCDVCGHIYERNYSYRKQKTHRCSKACVYGHRSTDGIGAHGAEVITEPCPTCGKEQTFRKIGGERKWGRFCSRECYGRFRSENPELYAENTAAMHTPEVADQISKTKKRQAAEPGYIHCQTGLKRNQKTKDLIRQRRLENPPVGPKNGMYGRKHSEEAKEKMSESVAQRILDGRMHAYGTRNKKGWYSSMKTGVKHFFRSSWEEAVMVHLDESDEVMTWDHEPLRIPYYRDDHKRWYVPDFLVTFADGHRELWEVKPKEFVNAKVNVLKASAAREWCTQNDVSEYRVLTGDDLREMKAI